MLTVLIRTLITLWPFIKENILGNRDIDYLSTRNRPLTLMLLGVLVMFGLFVYITDHALISTTDLQKARQEIRILTVRLEEAGSHDATRGELQLVLERRIAELERLVDLFREQTEVLQQQNQELLSLLGGEVPDTNSALQRYEALQAKK